MWSWEWDATLWMRESREAMMNKASKALKTAPLSLRNHILRLNCTSAEELEKAMLENFFSVYLIITTFC